MRKFDKLFLKEYIKTENPLFFDIGCYDGGDTLELKEIFPKSTIICFDVDERSIELFKKNVNVDGVHLYEMAISNKDGFVEWYNSTSDTRRHYEDKDWSASSSIKKPKNHLSLFKDVSFYKKDEFVKSCRLDTFVEENNLSGKKIDLMWVDVNGSEGDMLIGSENTLKNTDFLFIEFSNSELYEGEPNLIFLKEKLHDFVLIEIFDFYDNFGNAFFKKIKNNKK